MSDKYFQASERWATALRKLMGYPAHEPPFHTVAWCTSGPRDLMQIMNLTQLAADMQRDIVHLTFEEGADEPIAVSLAVRQEYGIEWMPNVVPYAAAATSKLELLADERRWRIGPRQVLTSAKLPPKGRWDKGSAIARRRWRQAAEVMKVVAVDGSVWVPAGGRYADAIPHEALRAA